MRPACSNIILILGGGRPRSETEEEACSTGAGTWCQVLGVLNSSGMQHRLPRHKTYHVLTASWWRDVERDLPVLTYRYIHQVSIIVDMILYYVDYR